MCKHCNNIITSLEDVSNHHYFHKKVYVFTEHVMRRVMCCVTESTNETNAMANDAQKWERGYFH